MNVKASCTPLWHIKSLADLWTLEQTALAPASAHSTGARRTGSRRGHRRARAPPRSYPEQTLPRPKTLPAPHLWRQNEPSAQVVRNELLTVTPRPVSQRGSPRPQCRVPARGQKSGAKLQLSSPRQSLTGISPSAGHS